MLQASIKSNPPIGVTKPMTLKSKAFKLSVANRYIDPENKITPEIVNPKIVFLVLKLK
jgi:hypothetical protein